MGSPVLPVPRPGHTRERVSLYSLSLTFNQFLLSTPTSTLSRG